MVKLYLYFHPTIVKLLLDPHLIVCPPPNYKTSNDMVFSNRLLDDIENIVDSHDKITYHSFTRFYNSIHYTGRKPYLRFTFVPVYICPTLSHHLRYVRWRGLLWSPRMGHKTPYDIVEGGLKHSLRSFPRVLHLLILFSLGFRYSKKLVL